MHTGEKMNKAEVLERRATNSGESVWQAEITVTQGVINHVGRTRVFTIRAPPRKAAEQAERDADQLNATAPEGAKAVRTLANALHRPS